MSAYVTAQDILPLSTDVAIQVSMAQTARRKNLTVMAIIGSGLGFLPNADRIRFYTDIDSVGNDFDAADEVYQAALIYFSQSPRPTTMAIAEIFATAQPARLLAPAYGAVDIAAIKLITTGSMKITIGSTEYTLTGMDFSGITTLANVVSVIQAKLTAGSVPATCTTYTAPGGDAQLIIVSTSTGDAAHISYPVTHSAGVFAAPALKLTAATGGLNLAGYTPGNIQDELTNVKNSAAAINQFIYGWAFVASLRVVETQLLAAAWCLAQQYAIMPLVSNDPLATDASYELDLGFEMKGLGNNRVFPLWHEDPYAYPDVSILAYMLHVNYELQASTVTAKFKELPGVPVSYLNTEKWLVLKGKKYNAYTAMESEVNVFREGNTDANQWWIDTRINIDNFVADLTVNVYNVFLRNKKVPYTRLGQELLIQACAETGENYVFNGSFADRLVRDLTLKTGVRILPAVDIIPTPIQNMSAADRAARVAPPIQLVVQEAGAMHSIAINVEVVS